jgi:hypothetical protein
MNDLITCIWTASYSPVRHSCQSDMFGPGWVLLLIALYLLPLLPRVLSKLSDAWRNPGAGGTLFVCLVLIACVYAYPSSASKGGGETNPPPVEVSAPAGRINLYHEDATGRLVPIGADIREVQP